MTGFDNFNRYPVISACMAIFAYIKQFFGFMVEIVVKLLRRK